MKHLSKVLTGVLGLTLAACSNEAYDGPVVPEGQGDVFASLSLSLPSGTRSATDVPGDGNNPSQSTDGYEIGKDFENNVENIYVVIADRADDNSPFTFVTSAYSASILDPTKPQPTFVVQFESQALKEKAGEQVYVFAYCNPTQELITMIDGLAAGNEFADKTGTISAGGTESANPSSPYQPITNGISKPKSFLMTNGSLQVTTLPSLETMIKSHNSKQTAFNLGNVKVERLASRFDFQQTTVNGENEPNLYPIKESISDQTVAKISLVGMALFNEAKEFYYLPRMSADGTNTNAIICGNELPTNYVVSPNAELKLAYSNSNGSGNVPDLFFSPITGKPSDFIYTPLAAIAGGTPDNDNSSQTPTWPSAGTDYKIWRYATENTIPGISAQRHGLTTGVVFKGEIKPIENPTAGTPAATLAAAMNAGETVYAFTDPQNDSESNISVMLGSALDVWKYAKSHNTSIINTQFVAAFNAGYFKITAGTETLAPGASTDEIFGDNVTAVSGQSSNVVPEFSAEKNFGFVAYAPVSENGVNKYYNYYYYYNRHNDNGNNSDMGPMEFASVRNNIYKLKVDDVMKFGVPGDTPPDPWTPDENPEVYFKVSVTVLDWVVRLNNIIL